VKSCVLKLRMVVIICAGLGRVLKLFDIQWQDVSNDFVPLMNERMMGK